MGRNIREFDNETDLRNAWKVRVLRASQPGQHLLVLQADAHAVLLAYDSSCLQSCGHFSVKCACCTRPFLFLLFSCVAACPAVTATSGPPYHQVCTGSLKQYFLSSQVARHARLQGMPCGFSCGSPCAACCPQGCTHTPD